MIAGASYGLVLLIFLTISLLALVTVQKNYPLESFIAKPATIIIPCYNESALLTASFRQRWIVLSRRYEIIIVNDGSTDDTWTRLQTLFTGHLLAKQPVRKFCHGVVHGIVRSEITPNILLINKENGGKSDALNAGLAYATHPLTITIDADTRINHSGLTDLLTPFDDPWVLATGGTLDVLPTQKQGHWLTRLQQSEYLRGCLLDKAVLGQYNAVAIISGALGAFRTDVVEKMGGYRHTVGEDIDITLQMYRYSHQFFQGKGRVVFVPYSVGFTQAPATLSDLAKQRIRWQKAFTDGVRLHGSWFLRHVRLPISQSVLAYMLVIGVGGAFVTLISIVVSVFSSDWENVVFLLGVELMVRAIQFMVSRIIARRLHLVVDSPWWLFLLDWAVYQWIMLAFAIYGTLAYFVNHGGWDKVERYEQEDIAEHFTANG